MKPLIDSLKHSQFFEFIHFDPTYRYCDITAKGLTVTAVAGNETYDGTTDAFVSLSDNRISGDVLTGNYTGAGFDNPNVGNGKAVTEIIAGTRETTLGGTISGNSPYPTCNGFSCNMVSSLF
jgi:hypothetical protein